MQRTSMRPRPGWTGALLLAVFALAGCGQSPPAAVDVVQSYLGAVAEGDFTEACATLDHRARRSLRIALDSRLPCSTLLPRCFPNEATLLEKDQTQLMYATARVDVTGSRADAATGGTLVAKRIKEVRLVERKGLWKLDSYGEERCLRPGRRR